MNKNTLRTQYKEKRVALPEQERLRNDDLLLIQFQQIAIPYHTATLLSYWPIRKQAEVNTHLMTDYLRFRVPGLQVYYPVMNIENESMNLIAADETTLFHTNKYGITEPSSGKEIAPTAIDIVLVPLLIFDEHGHRIGYGKGFYDRLLHQCRGNCLTIGLSYFDPVTAIADVDDFDVPLSIVVTPDSLYEF
jgi:5-formyltetrahydrofolate cyclo-ligase